VNVRLIIKKSLSLSRKLENDKQKIMSSDLTFITNEENKTLRDRFTQLIKDSRYFDVLVGYFYTSGFYALYPTLETTEKVRILIGIGTGKDTVNLIARSKENAKTEQHFSHAEVKEQFEKEVMKEMEHSDDTASVEEGIERFISWLKSGKLEIRAYPSQNIHAKLYIMTFKEGDRDVGRVITGSSNFTQSGLSDNLEFNVELKNRSDYEFAATKFESLWRNSVDVGEKYIQSVKTHTWINPNITPYELYLKFLYEYFKDELSLTDEIFIKYLPQSFKKYDYQQQAVLNAKKIVEEYGGVFISDVVGLGKTYIATMLAGQLDGRTLVIAPPALLDRNNPGSWPNVFSDFHIPADFESVGKLDSLLERGVEKYANVIIDEAHRFRTETTIGYDLLAQICRGKRVILISATPYNNSPMDILSQIKLFQNPRMSTIPNLPDLEGFFKERENRLKKINKQKNYDEYLRVAKENAREIRDRVLKYLMVRRTRSEIEKYFTSDVKEQNLKFPETPDPIPLYYELNDTEDSIFNETIQLITQQFKYVRYTPLLYYQGKITHMELTSQKNMGGFMKVLLVKRLESSFHAFRRTIDRFIRSYEMFIKTFDEGSVYVSKKYTQKIFELLENDDDEAIQLLIDENKAQKYDSSDFNDRFKDDLQNDLDILKKIQSLWQKVKRDPKLEKLQYELSNNSILKDKKIVLFTESRETAEYLASNIKDKVICYHGSSSETIRDKIIDNFDARVKHPKDDYRILIATEVLSEGVNLHRSNVVINYDIPWNPTRMMQRVGRINRVDTPFDKIYTFNFFPTVQSEDQIQLRKTAEAKINAFLTLLGGDAALLTEGEPVTSHELFNRLISKETLSGEDDMAESELKYLNIIKNIRDRQPDLFEKIKRLPKKARSSKNNTSEPLPGDSLLTYFRWGKLQKFFLSVDGGEPKEVDFIMAAGYFDCDADEPKQPLKKDFYQLLDQNKKAFEEATIIEENTPGTRRGRDAGKQVSKILRAVLQNGKQLTDEQEDWLRKIITRFDEGAIPKKTAKNTLKALKELGYEVQNPLKVLAVLGKTISPKLLESHYAEYTKKYAGKKEVILSLYLIKNEHD